MIDAWQLGGFSNDITRRVENFIKRSAQTTEQALEQVFVKKKAIFHKKCLCSTTKKTSSGFDRRGCSCFYPNINIYLLTTLSSRTPAVF